MVFIYTGSTGRRQASPMEVFAAPICYRVTAWIWPILLASCIALVIVQAIGAGSANGGLYIAAAFIASCCFFFVIESITGCVSVKSIQYIQFPCCLSQKELERIEQDCTSRTPYFMMPTVKVRELPLTIEQNNKSAK
ncbi:Hypothetical_protein [Hexamita inflata]|uniref:Hypothetical_protein n=1 Tax=Hexamita inflata TaxID=28002 RepID=A0ABP1GDV8_9EUKA